MNPELVVNLWAIYDAEFGFVYGLAGRVYNMAGSDSEKLALLKRLSATDYITAKRPEVPSRFKVSYADGASKSGVTFLNAVYEQNNQLFEDVFGSLEFDLPPVPIFLSAGYQSIKQTLPDAPLCVTTVLYEDGDGGIRPIITDEDREWIALHEKKIHGV